jgi:hypothetical protein
VLNWGSFQEKRRIMQIFKIEFVFKIVKKYGDKMKNSSKILLGFMLVMMICCVSAVSATDINGTDDTLVTDDVAVDDVSEIVEDVEADDASDSIVGEGNLRGGANSVTVNSTNYGQYFDLTTGYTTTHNNLTFDGNFENLNFTTFVIDKKIVIDAYNATFKNTGFNLKTSDIVLNGGTFIGDENTTLTSVIQIEGSYAEVSDVTMDVVAPSGADFYAIDMKNGVNHAKVLNSVINYVAPYANTANFNYVVKVRGGSNNTLSGNNITALLPLKDVDYSHWSKDRPTIDYDLVAGVAVEQCDHFNFLNNKLDVTGVLRAGWYPTLSALLIVKSDSSKVIGNEIYERDNATGQNETNYLYAVDIYSCNGIEIDSNVIELNTFGGNLTVNGTGAAYGIQMTGPHTNVVVSNNNITTANNGPNLGIYSQNALGTTSVTITGNRINVTGKAGDNEWDLVSGMELQDSYAYVSGNIIRVNNTAGYNASYCAYGISYSQWTNQTPHYFEIENNNVEVINGRYAVYLRDDATGLVTENKLVAIPGSGNIVGDNAVLAPPAPEVIVGGNY